MKAEENQSVRIVQAVVKYRRMIQAYSNAIVRDFHLAEDVYQEVAIVVAGSETLPRDEELLPWLREITRRKSLEAIRKHRKTPLLLQEDTLAVLADKFTEDLNEQNETQVKNLKKCVLQECVQRLRGMSKKVIDLRYGQEEAFSCEEIAVKLQRSTKAIYNVMARARLALTQCVQKEKMQWREDK